MLPDCNMFTLAARLPGMGSEIYLQERKLLLDARLVGNPANNWSKQSKGKRPREGTGVSFLPVLVKTDKYSLVI